MSEPHQESDSMSMDRNIQVHANIEGENQIYIPYWEEEGSSGSHLNHLMEEVRILKNKCIHLENHLEESHHQFYSLNELYLRAEANERNLIRENQMLRMELKNQITHFGKKEIQWRENYNSLKFELQQKIVELEHENQLLRREARQASRILPSSIDDQDNLRDHFNQQLRLRQTDWKIKSDQFRRKEEELRANYQQLQRDYDKLKEEYNKTSDSLKSSTKQCNRHKEEFQLRKQQMQNEIDELKTQLKKTKNKQIELDKQLKDLKSVLQDVSLKNDEYQTQNQRLKTKLNEEGNRYSKLNQKYKECEARERSVAEQFSECQNAKNQLTNQCTSLKAKIARLQKQITQLKTEKQAAQLQIDDLERTKNGLRQEIERLKRKKETQIQQLNGSFEARIEEVKNHQEEQRKKYLTKTSELENKIKELQIEINELIRTKPAQNCELPDPKEAEKHKAQLEQARKKIKMLEDKNTITCGHDEELEKLKGQLHRLTHELKKYQLKLIDLKKQNDELTGKLDTLTEEKDTQELQIIRLQADKKKWQKAKEDSDKNKNKLQKQLIELRDELQRSRYEDGAEQFEKDEKIQQLAEQLKQKDQKIAELKNKTQTLKKELQGSRQNTSKQNDEDTFGQMLNLHSIVAQKDKQLQAMRKKIAALQQVRSKDLQKINQLQETLASRNTIINSRMATLESQIKVFHRNQQHLNEQLNRKNQIIQQLQQQLQVAPKNIKEARSQPDQSVENELRNQIAVLKKTLAEQDATIVELRHQIKEQPKEQEADEEELAKLEAQYKKQLLALKRLIDYKGGRSDDKKIEYLKKDYQLRIEDILQEYKVMQNQMHLLRQQVLNRNDTSRQNTLEVAGRSTMEQQRWMVQVERLSQQKQILMSKVSNWQWQVQQLRKYYELKLDTHLQTIGLLQLKIDNMELQRINNCSCGYAAPHYHP